MRKIAEVIKRLYNTGRLTDAELLERMNKGTITLQEYNEIKEG